MDSGVTTRPARAENITEVDYEWQQWVVSATLTLDYADRGRRRSGSRIGVPWTLVSACQWTCDYS